MNARPIPRKALTASESSSNRGLPRRGGVSYLPGAARGCRRSRAGWTGMVGPAAGLPRLARRHGGAVIEVNPTPGEVTPVADILLQGPAGEVSPRLVAAIHETARGAVSAREHGPCGYPREARPLPRRAGVAPVPRPLPTHSSGESWKTGPRCAGCGGSPAPVRCRGFGSTGAALPRVSAGRGPRCRGFRLDGGSRCRGFGWTGARCRGVRLDGGGVAEGSAGRRWRCRGFGSMGVAGGAATPRLRRLRFSGHPPPDPPRCPKAAVNGRGRRTGQQFSAKREPPLPRNGRRPISVR